MAITLVTSALIPQGVTSGDSSSIDTTGADLLVMLGASFILPTLSDSKSNTWNHLTSQSTGALHEARTRISYAWNPTVGTGHVFSWDYAGYGNTTLIVLAFSGALTASDPFDNENGANTNSNVSTIQPGSMTPTEDNCVVVSACGFGTGTSGLISIDGGFTIAQQDDATGSDIPGSAGAYLIQTTAAAANPTFTSASGTAPASAVIASFKAAGGGGGGGSSTLLMHVARILN